MAIGKQTIDYLANKLNEEAEAKGNNTNWGVAGSADISEADKEGIFLLLCDGQGVIASSTRFPNDQFSADNFTLKIRSIPFTETAVIGNGGTPTTFKIVKGKTASNTTEITQADNAVTVAKKYIINEGDGDIEELFTGNIAGGTEMTSSSQFALTNISVTFN